MCGLSGTGLSSSLMAALPLGGSALVLIAGLGGWMFARRAALGWPSSGTAPRGAALMPADPVAILRERYARGEMDITTFRERVERLVRTGG